MPVLIHSLATLFGTPVLLLIGTNTVYLGMYIWSNRAPEWGRKVIEVTLTVTWLLVQADQNCKIEN